MRSGWTRNRLRGLLVVSEIALALVAMIGAGLFIRSMQNAQKVDPGFESKNLFMMAFDLGALHYNEGRGEQFYRDAMEKASAAPGVASATLLQQLSAGRRIRADHFPGGTERRDGLPRNVDATERRDAELFRDAAHSVDSRKNIQRIGPRDYDASGDCQRGDGETFLARRRSRRKAVSFLRRSDAAGSGGCDGQFRGEPDWRGACAAGVFAVDAGLFARSHFAGADARRIPRRRLGRCETRCSRSTRTSRITNVQTIGAIMSQGLWAPRMGAALLTLVWWAGVNSGGDWRVWRAFVFGESAIARDWNSDGVGGATG